MDLLIQFGGGGRRWARWLCLFVPALFTLPLAAQGASEYELKAEFLHKFASFVEWPQEAGPHRCIGVVGQDPFGFLLDQTVAGKFEVRRYRAGQESAECQIVFVAASERKRLHAVLDHLRAGPVLTVSDIPGFCEQGGIINLELNNRHISLEINPDAAARARLQVSSRLLTMARIVRDIGKGAGKP